MQAASEVGKVGGRNTRAADGSRSASGRFVVAAGGKDRQIEGRQRVSRFARAASAGNDSLLLAVDALPQPDRVQRRIADRKRRTAWNSSIASSNATSASAADEFFDLQARRLLGAAGEFDPAGNALLAEVAALAAAFLEAMDDDFNTGAAPPMLFELVRDAQQVRRHAKSWKPASPMPPKLATLETGATVLKELAGVLGLFRQAGRTKSGWRRRRAWLAQT